MVRGMLIHRQTRQQGIMCEDGENGDMKFDGTNVY